MRYRIELLVLIVTFCLFATICSKKQSEPTSEFSPEVGDLMFQDLDGSPFYDAIETVTKGYQGASLSHIGIVTKDSSGKIFVLEAILAGVSLTPLFEFLARSYDNQNHPKVLVSRLKPKYRHQILPALKEAQKLIGKPYDNFFDIENDAYYCSEVIYKAFLKSTDNQSLFKLQPMTFVDPSTGETFPIWQEYFAELGVAIPEGKLGINPGEISRSKAIDIIYNYGIPNGWKKLNK
ncbi:MAG TPA: YiiX/YebB-like N1pC/P60 family cysteine hydrolase [Candidatus Marinimicrobia bacterium]|nr:YiiX/YebB-like N1pC/P60 family cysteine hydrolase [Candidatus Neomarinimicrobiota bacterium]HQE94797.1 YiiX/YebB-like N1pC/P60 family cysteine hydrolase [Candidatus Neomarinimicrobiota bacterium]HQH55668.1 YiiX/YebB-like N1pC/P60 family cysteine hydrolase [Candidatus Neomarinimicrobiota bacterium]HQK12183.1 YiiX/YebB-like N1pC/P60 family cysteine hydrolase [Candidatus Neomarinimicrobiota bacterium]